MDFYSYPDTNNSTKYQPGENAIVAYNPDNAREASVDPYDLDMSPSIQEALHRSNMDVRYQQIVYLIPLFFSLNSGHALCLEILCNIIWL
jgi:BRCA1/BRCA2-containing complex subunit 3